MGIFESMLRSQGNINQIAGVVQGYFKRKHEGEVRDKVKELFTTYGGGAQKPTDAGIQPAKEVPVPGQVTGEPGMRPVRGQPEVASSAAPISFAGPIERQSQPRSDTPVTKSMRGIESADDIYNLADLTEQDPSKMVQDATAEEAKNVPKTHFGTRGEVYQIDRKGQIRKIQGPEYPPVRPAAAKEPKPSLLRSSIQNVNGVKKQVDYYGFKDESGERVTEKKYSDFTPKKGMNLTGVGGDGKAPKEFKRSAALKALDAKKQAIERELKRAYPEVDLDHAIVNGVDPADTSPSAGMVQKWLKAVDGYETRAATEGEDIDSAFSVAQRHLSEQPISTHAPATAGEEYGKPFVNKKTGERIRLNNKTKKWEKIPANK